jgi:L-lactate dehydrogenase complex protein LldE
MPRPKPAAANPPTAAAIPNEARSVALAQLNLFVEPWPVVVPSGSCGGMMRSHYPHLFAADPELHAKAVALAERVFELSEFSGACGQFQPRRPGRALHHCPAHVVPCAPPDGRTRHQFSLARQPGPGGSGGRRRALKSAAALAARLRCCTPIFQRPSSPTKWLLSRQWCQMCGQCRLRLPAQHHRPAAKQDELAGIKSPTLPGEHLASFLWRRTSKTTSGSAT